MKFLPKQSNICAEGSTSSDSTKQQDSSCQKSSLPLLRNRQEAPHHKLPDTKASKQKYRQWIDTAVIQKSWSQKRPWKREIGGACSRDWGVESRAKGRHERPGFIPEASAGKSREPLGRERKESVSHRPWGLARWGEWGLLSRLGQSQPEWEGLCYDDPTWISHKFPGFLRRKVTNKQ